MKNDPKSTILWFNDNVNSAYNNQTGHKYWVDNVFLSYMKDEWK